jgi:hypothetical protein
MQNKIEQTSKRRKWFILLAILSAVIWIISPIISMSAATVPTDSPSQMSSSVWGTEMLHSTHIPMPTLTPGGTVCNPILTLTDDPSLFPDPSLTSFTVTSGVGTVTVDSINSGTGLRVFSVVSSSNVVVNIPPFTPGTFAPVTATFTVINPNLPVDINLRVNQSISRRFDKGAMSLHTDTFADG